MGLQSYVNVAVAVGAIGTLGVNIAYRKLQRTHRNAEYCTVPVEILRSKQKCLQLLGGGSISVKNLNFKKSTLTNTVAKTEIPVKGNTRGGYIYTMSTRENEDMNWDLQYAIFVVRSKQKSWTIWLHPENEKYEGELPESVLELQTLPS